MNLENKNKWVSVSLADGMIFEGTVEAEMPYGLYLHIGGQEERLSLFPWHQITRVVYKSNA